MSKVSLMRDNNINALRFFAASMVVYSHAYALGGGTREPLVLGQSPGTVAVYTFMLLSGYLIALSWARDPCFRRYLVRRASRIFPGLIVCVLLALLVLGPLVTTCSLGEYFGSAQTWRYLTNMALVNSYSLPGVFEGNPSAAVNGSLWTLQYEFVMYVLLAVIVAKRPNHGRRGLLLAFVACMVVHYVAFFNPGIDFLGSHFLFNLVRLGRFFLIGALWAHADAAKRLDSQHSFAALLAMLVLGGEGGVFADVVLLVLLPVAIMPFATRGGAAFAGFFKGVDVSYGIYIYAFPVQQLLVMLFGCDVPCFVMALLAECITLPLALASWSLVEGPALDFGRKLVGRVGSCE